MLTIPPQIRPVADPISTASVLPTARTMDWRKAKQEAPRSGGKSELELFRAVLDQFILTMGEARPPAAPEPARVRTPRSSAPMQAMQIKPNLRGKTRGLTLFYTCPACCRPQAVASKMAGHRVRCRHCAAAVRAPFPAKGWEARVVENNVEALLHPEKYLAAKRPVPWKPLLRQAAAILVLLVVLAGFVVRKLKPLISSPAHQATVEDVAATPAPVPTPAIGMGKDFAKEAMNLAARFLEARHFSSVAPDLVSPSHNAHAIQEFLSRPEPQRKVSRIEAEGTGFLNKWNAMIPVTHVSIEFEDGRSAILAVVDDAEGCKLDWQASVIEGVGALDLVPGTRTAKVLATLDDYYNNSFSNENLLCVRLQNPASDESAVWGYVGTKNAEHAYLRQLLESAPTEEPVPLMLEIEATPQSQATRQVRILRVLAEGWHESERMTITKS